MQLGKAIILMLTIQQSCLALYIKKAEKSPAKAPAPSPSKDDWGVFKNTLGLSQEKVELLKSQKDQQGTKELLNRFILENPKALPKVKKQPDQFLALYRSILKKLTASKRTLKTSLNFELADKPHKTHKRPRRKIAVKMVSDMPSWKIESLLNTFYLQHGIPKNTEEHDYPDLDMPRDTDYDSDNFYDDEGDVGLTAKTRQNTEYGSFQDLIMQAKMNEWELENEETKLHGSANDDFI
ncbi:uncharacterized protein LOC108045656 [Drosophila rhopaloa]|uniref:Uncharacterized protein LOC108045656 n=1 Tax=Drosophila rhopaloa TaxID=1041015 RepID=A0A6P4EQT1_DRORH|nr:uncharacterized protein LOC108045656 [Drosophila rhopaloa]